VRHLHVDAASLQFVEHLGDAFGSGFRSARPVDPADVIVALVVWTSVVLPPQPSAFSAFATSSGMG